MKQKKPFFNPYGLRARLGLSVALSAAVCILLFFILNVGFSYAFTNYCKHSDFEHNHFQKQCESLQRYVDNNDISTENLYLLAKWEKKQPIILLEIYTENQCIYSSPYDVPTSSMLYIETNEMDNHVHLKLKNKQVIALIYSDFTYSIFLLGKVLSAIAALLLFLIIYMHKTRKLILYICRLNKELQILEGGNLEYSISEEGNDEITDLARGINHMKASLQNQMETEQKLYQANRQLITEMSHDLRTPLTGIMLYLEILRSHHYETEDQLQDYLEKIDAKAHHLKILSDHLFEYSMQGLHDKQSEPLSLEAAFSQMLNTLQNDLMAHGFTVESALEWNSCFVQVNSEYLNRIIDNIVSNIEKYAEKSATIHIDTLYSDTHCGFSVMNTLSINHHSPDSNQIGIESICNMMKQMNGICNVEQTDTTFIITLLFPRK